MHAPAGWLRYVNLLQGTDSHHGFSTGNTLPLVARPFGMNHWSAQTDGGSNWFFSPHHRKLQGIRCTHQPSPWIGDYGHFTVMANTGAERHLSAWRRGRAYRGQFHPHYFRAELLNDGTVIEMSPTERGAIFRFQFPTGGGRVVFEPCAGNSKLEFRDATTVVGSVDGNSGGVPAGFAHYFVAVFDDPATETLAFRGDNIVTETEGEQVGFVATFPANVTLRIATSFISIEQAFLNLEREIPPSPKAFEATFEAGEKVWEAALGRIEVASEDETKLRTFYSCLYRTQLFPRMWHETDAAGTLHHRSPYSGKVHDGPLYTDNGFWDTYRTVYPLFSLLMPDRLSEILEGWTNAYKEGGWFPQWASPGYRACMVGTHIDAVMADGVARGITGFDVKSALEGMLKHAHQVGDADGAWGRIGIEDYEKLGYVSTAHHESVARSLDYAYDDWCIQQVAKHQGVDAEEIAKRTSNYRHLYDPSVDFMRAKQPDGKWQEPWDEFHWGNPYVEGGPWQSSFAVQHDVAGLARLMGGEANFVEKLDRLLAIPPYFTTGAYGQEIHEMTEMAVANFGQYAHSNQPVHHILYLFAAVGRPWRTQKEVRRVMAELYSPTHLPGDEDNGEMCAWYILSALGIFPLTPGHPTWTLGSPLFAKATLHLAEGKSFVVEGVGNDDDHVYASSISLNGSALARGHLTHGEVVNGGRLTFTMSTHPNETIMPVGGRPFSLS